MSQAHRLAGRDGKVVFPNNVVAAHLDAARLKAGGTVDVVNDRWRASSIGIVSSDPLIGHFDNLIAVRGGKDVFSRFEKTAQNYGAMLKLAFIRRYLRILC